MKILEENRRESSGNMYTLPSADHYPYQWLWDSCFHAIILARYDAKLARGEIRSLLSKQFDNGMLPHIIYWTPGILHLFRWGVEGTSSLTQPPMVAYAVREIHRRDPDIPFLEDVFPSLIAYYRYLLTVRDPMGYHLAGIINPDESGEDNSPRFDEPLGISHDVTLQEHLGKRHALVDAHRELQFDITRHMNDYFWVKDVLFNAVLVENLRALADIALLINRDDDSAWAGREAEAVAAAMRERMFEDGAYWSTMGKSFMKLKVDTWARFVPLFAGLYSATEARAAVEGYLKDPDAFAAPWGIRTVSKKEVSYRPAAEENDFSWRGPVWMAPHWFIYRGLVRYGFTEEARGIREKSVALLEHSGFRECFNPETGEAYGARSFTWGALVLDMQEDGDAS